MTTEPESPIARSSTTRPKAGMVFKDGRQFPALVLLLIAVLSLFGLLTAAAMGDVAWTAGLGAIVLVTGVAGAAWMLWGRRRSATGGGRHER